MGTHDMDGWVIYDEKRTISLDKWRELDRLNWELTRELTRVKPFVIRGSE